MCGEMVEGKEGGKEGEKVGRSEPQQLALCVPTRAS